MLKRLSKLLKAAMAKFSISKESVLYTRYYNSLAVDTSLMLIENCKGISDNPETLKELCDNPNCKALKKYMVVSDFDASKVNSDIELIKPLSKKHLRLLAGAGFVIGDYMPDFYIKRDEQIYICTQGEDCSFSKKQRSLIISSLAQCDSRQSLDDIRNKYMLSAVYSGSYAVGGVSDVLLSALGSDNGVSLITGDSFSGGKENVLIFTGSLDKNGITTALKNLLSYLDDDRNYIPFFYEKGVEVNKDSVSELGGKDYISICGDMNMSLFEALVLGLYFFNIKPFKNTRSMIDRIYHREIKRCFGGVRADYVIHFTGYARSVLQLICRLDAKRLVWVHNNMFLEQKTKGNVHIDTVKYGYEMCDKIVVVRDTMKAELEAFVEPEQRDKITVVHNINDIESIISKSGADVEFQEDTYCNTSTDTLCSILEDRSITKIINIARFSQEKGIDRLITAFDRYKAQCDATATLIIIGGYGEEFEKIKAMVDDREGIILIKSINNPYPILKKCDLFVLSSHYEGLPMTIIEALILGIPVASTDITGPREFLSNGYGMLVDDSEQGIFDAMSAYKNNSLDITAQFDAVKFNNTAMAEFKSLFE